MFFEVVRYKQASRSTTFPRVTLMADPWDDYGYKTTFSATFHERNDTPPRALRGLKILQRGSEKTRLALSFERLPDDYCSLGASAEYYHSLQALPSATIDEILIALRDVTRDASVYETFKTEPGFEISLLRFQEARDALAEGIRLFQGISVVDELDFAFTFTTKAAGFLAAHEVSLEFGRNRPLGRTAVLIGPNGAGKTSLLGRLAYCLLGLVDSERSEVLSPMPRLPGGVLAISWSAFDRFEIPRGTLPTRYFYCGLRVFESPDVLTGHEPRSLGQGRSRYERLDLHHAIRQAAEALAEFSTSDREWLLDALTRMRLGEAALCRTVAEATGVEVFASALGCFSAGQQLVIYTLVHLRARLSPGTMVLFDEPEAHLHPALLSMLIRELNSLLTERDSFAILATHSPLLLQEIPSRQVVILEVEGGRPRIRLYQGETFGETISLLLERVFKVGGEQRNWRTILDGYRDHNQLDDLRSVLKEALNLPLSGLFDDDSTEPSE
jgi:predicted ATPase